MVVRLRLQRFGRHDRPFYRIVAADSRSPRDGRFIELVGSYDPIASKDGIKEVRLKSDRLKYWLSVGAQPSDRVAWLMSKYNLMPPAPLPPSTMQHLPRTERKEFKEALAAKAKAAAAGGGGGGGGAAKKYHTVAGDRRAGGEAAETDTAAFLTGGAVMAQIRATMRLPWVNK